MPIQKWSKTRLLSILTSEISPKTFSVTLGGALLFFLMGAVCLNLFVDPYFIFRKSPFESRLASIDSHQRFAKSLQVITRQPEIVLLGSSRVYRGFDVKNNKKIYNMGISSLSLTEAASYVDHILCFTKAHTIVLGLDFWMCDESTPTQPGWDNTTGTFSYAANSFLSALFQIEETYKTLKFLLKKNKVMKHEGWTYEGFFYTQPLSKKDIDDKLLSYEEVFKKVHIQLNKLSLLEDIIHKCQNKNVKLYAYISPLHPETKRIYKNSPNAPYFDPWRKKSQDICKKNNIPFQDFADLLEETPPLNQGSNDFWLDYSHFTPTVGLFILKTLKVY